MDFFCVGMNAWSDGIMTLEELEEVGDCLGVCGWAWLCSAFKQFSYVHFAREMDLPWNKNSPTMLEARPNDPTITTSLGFDISGRKRSVNRTVRVERAANTWSGEESSDRL